MERFKGERRQGVEECKAPVSGLRTVETNTERKPPYCENEEL